MLLVGFISFLFDADVVQVEGFYGFGGLSSCLRVWGFGGLSSCLQGPCISICLWPAIAHRSSLWCLFRSFSGVVSAGACRCLLGPPSLSGSGLRGLAGWSESICGNKSARLFSSFSCPSLLSAAGQPASSVPPPCFLRVLPPRTRLCHQPSKWRW
jgi:hypothetical protein